VRVRLFKGHIQVEGCRSPYSLLNAKVGTYGEANKAWTGAEAAAFCKLYGLQSALAYSARNKSPEPNLTPATTTHNGGR